MKRRDFIRNVALSSSMLLLPRALMSFKTKQMLQIVIIGDSNLRYIEEFCKQNAITCITSIGSDEEHPSDFRLSNCKNLEFDFASITVNYTQPLKNSVLLPRRIKNIFEPNGKYLILCSLYRKEAILAKEIINWLYIQQINHWFFGTIPLLNPRIAPWAEKLFVKYENNNNIIIINTNELASEYSDMPVSDVVAKCDDMLVTELNYVYRNVEYLLENGYNFKV